MPNGEAIEETYHGFKLLGRPLPSLGDYEGWIFRAFLGDSLQFTLKIILTGSAAVLHGGRENASQTVQSIGLHQVKGMIDLRRYAVGGEYEEWIRTQAEPQPKVLDQEVRQSLLQALYNIYRMQPSRAQLEALDVEGFCAVVGIDRATYEFNASYLKSKGYIAESPLAQRTLSNGGIYLTAEGIDLVEKTEHLSSTVDQLFASTRTLVDAGLAQTAPAAAAKLLEIYSQLTTTGTSLQWKQIAYACRDILEDFTEAILLPEHVPPGELRPERNKTKSKLRFVLTAKAKESQLSETHRDFILAQVDYLMSYFDRLNALLQRNVHSPQITKSDADRCVIYTYLLVAEVLSLLRLTDTLDT